MRVCLVVPHYDHLDQFRQYLPRLLEFDIPLFVIDDASPAAVRDGLITLLAELSPNATLMRHDRNQGKGGAVMSGLRAAMAAGFTHALQVDADGQHDVAAIPEFLRAGKESPDVLFCGEPQFADSIPGLRYYARYITLSLSWLETLSTEIRDALCGFRLYPLAAVMRVLNNCTPGRRMAFDPEILVRAVWAGVPLQFIPVSVKYPDDGTSHFQYLRDNFEIAWMHTRLIMGMILRIPQLLRQRRTRALAMK